MHALILGINQINFEMASFTHSKCMTWLGAP